MPGEGIGVELVRVIRIIDRVERRLAVIEQEMEELRRSDLYHLTMEARRAKEERRELLAELGTPLDARIEARREELHRARQEVRLP